MKVKNHKPKYFIESDFILPLPYASFYKYFRSKK